MASKKRDKTMATKKRIVLCVPVLLNEIEDIHSKFRLKIERALKIRNDDEAVRRVLREMKDML